MNSSEIIGEGYSRDVFYLKEENINYNYNQMVGGDGLEWVHGGKKVPRVLLSRGIIFRMQPGPVNLASHLDCFFPSSIKKATHSCSLSCSEFSKTFGTKYITRMFLEKYTY